MLKMTNDHKLLRGIFLTSCFSLDYNIEYTHNIIIMNIVISNYKIIK